MVPLKSSFADTRAESFSENYFIFTRELRKDFAGIHAFFGVLYENFHGFTVSPVKIWFFFYETLEGFI